MILCMLFLSLVYYNANGNGLERNIVDVLRIVCSLHGSLHQNEPLNARRGRRFSRLPVQLAMGRTSLLEK